MLHAHHERAIAISDRSRGKGKRVGETGFEPATPCTPCRCATKLRHSPVGGRIAHGFSPIQQRSGLPAFQQIVKEKVLVGVSSMRAKPVLGPLTHPLLGERFSVDSGSILALNSSQDMDVDRK